MTLPWSAMAGAGVTRVMSIPAPAISYYSDINTQTSMAGLLNLSLQTINVNACFQDSPLDLPSLLLEAFVYRLSDGRLHEVHVANYLRREGVPKVLVELPILQVI